MHSNRASLTRPDCRYDRPSMRERWPWLDVMAGPFFLGSAARCGIGSADSRGTALLGASATGSVSRAALVGVEFVDQFEIVGVVELVGGEGTIGIAGFEERHRDHEGAGKLERVILGK